MYLIRRDFRRRHYTVIARKTIGNRPIPFTLYIDNDKIHQVLLLLAAPVIHASSILRL